MSTRRFARVLATLAVSISVAACTPVESGPTGSPTGGTPPSILPTTDAPASVAPTERVEPRTVEPLPKEEYPAEVGGFTLIWAFGASGYDRGEDDRIGVRPHVRAEPVGQWLEMSWYDYEETRPGVWCFEASLHEECMVNGTTGRMWTVTNQFDSLSREELAAWAEQFMAVIP